MLAEPERVEPVRSVVPENILTAMLEMATTSPQGCFVEVGVYQGGSAQHLMSMALCMGRELFLYDTFTGIPFRDPIDSHVVGDFSDTDFLDVCERFPRAHVIPGIFPSSAVVMPAVAFVHLDCDQYRSVGESLDYLLPRMAEGGIIWFDDSPCLDGARTAARERLGDRLVLHNVGRHYVIL
jgi:Macrocin-O-methyltransferase (TylF)